MTTTGTRRYRNLIARGIALWERRGAWGRLWTPAPGNGRTSPGAGQLTHLLLVKVTILAGGYWALRVLQGVM